jgi:hypothetical protein
MQFHVNCHFGWIGKDVKNGKIRAVHHAVFNCFAWKYLIPIIHGRILKGSH